MMAIVAGGKSVYGTSDWMLLLCSDLFGMMDIGVMPFEIGVGCGAKSALVTMEFRPSFHRSVHSLHGYGRSCGQHGMNESDGIR